MRQANYPFIVSPQVWNREASWICLISRTILIQTLVEYINLKEKGENRSFEAG